MECLRKYLSVVRNTVLPLCVYAASLKNIIRIHRLASDRRFDSEDSDDSELGESRDSDLDERRTSRDTSDSDSVELFSPSSRAGDDNFILAAPRGPS